MHELVAVHTSLHIQRAVHVCRGEAAAAGAKGDDVACTTSIIPPALLVALLGSCVGGHSGTVLACDWHLLAALLEAHAALVAALVHAACILLLDGWHLNGGHLDCGDGNGWHGLGGDCDAGICCGSGCCCCWGRGVGSSGGGACCHTLGEVCCHGHCKKQQRTTQESVSALWLCQLFSTIMSAQVDGEEGELCVRDATDFAGVLSLSGISSNRCFNSNKLKAHAIRTASLGIV